MTKIKDCMKGFTRGVSKVIPPELTCKAALKKMRGAEPRIISDYFSVPRASTIPQYRVTGTPYYNRIMKLFFSGGAVQGVNGKGHSGKQALASGLMELAERYSCYKYILDNRDPAMVYSFKDLPKNNLFQLDDLYGGFAINAEVGVLKHEGLQSAPLRWYQGYSLDGRKTFIPIGAILGLLAGTNGLAAGNSFEEALLHGVCEVIERHCLSLIELYRLKTPLIDPATVNSSIGHALIGKFQSLGHRVLLKDFSIGMGLPVVGVVRIIGKTNCLVTAGVATTREEALIRALTENSQAEDKMHYVKIRAARHYFAHDRTIAASGIVNIDNRNMRVELEEIGRILDRRNMKIFFFDATDKKLGIPSVIVYIRGAKTIYFHQKVTGRNVCRFLLMMSLDTERYADFSWRLARAVKNGHISSPEYFYLKGLVLKRRRRYKESLPLLSRAVTGTADAAEGTDEFELRIKSLVNLGLTYQALDNLRAAIRCYLKIMDISPDFNIGDLAFYYDSIPSLSKSGDLFSSARKLYQSLRLLRKRLPEMPPGKFISMFCAYLKNKNGAQGNV